MLTWGKEGLKKYFYQTFWSFKKYLLPLRPLNERLKDN